MQEVDGIDGARVLRMSEPQSVPAKPREATHKQDAAAVQLPPWATNAAPREVSLSVPLAPSRLEAYAPDESGDPLPAQPARHRPTQDEPPPPSPAMQTGDNRFLRGTLTHALLQHLPTLPASGWQKAATGFLDLRGAALSASARRSIAKETLAILGSTEFAPLFGPQSRAEVPIVAVIPNPHGKGPPLKLTGQLDRVVDLGNEVLVVDYKTNRPPPASLGEVPQAYVLQLALYRALLEPLYPGRTVKAALLFTETPELMALPDSALDEALARLTGA